MTCGRLGTVATGQQEAYMASKSAKLRVRSRCSALGLHSLPLGVTRSCGGVAMHAFAACMLAAVGALVCRAEGLLSQAN